MTELEKQLVEALKRSEQAQKARDKYLDKQLKALQEQQDVLIEHYNTVIRWLEVSG